MFKLIIFVLIFNILCNNFQVPAVPQDEDETKKLDKEKIMLQRLGLSKQPVNINRTGEEERSVTSFMMTIHSGSFDQSPSVNNTNDNFHHLDFKKINESDLIATFMPQQPLKGRGGKPDKIQRMWFDVLLIGEGQKILGTDLRFYRDTSKTIDKYRDLSFNMTVYRTDLTGGKRNFIYVNSTIVDADFNGWVVLDITDCFKWWTGNINTNNGLKIITTPISRTSSKRFHQVKPEQLGIVGFETDPDKHAFAVGYYQSTQQGIEVPEVSNVISRHPRSTNIHDYIFEDQSLDESLMNPSEIRTNRLRKSRCNLIDQTLDFVDIGFDFIVYPSMIDMNDCIGTCRFPFPVQANATNHAVYKTMLGKNEVSRLNLANCIPISFAERQFLYYVNNNILLHLKWKEASATACGCRGVTFAAEEPDGSPEIKEKSDFDISSDGSKDDEDQSQTSAAFFLVDL
ncbi:protein 60A-like [Microplitis mediator]|uniref:protein 60A-like n=1 Tax=Microplitis mediator TaxID=375433 RepID=UPI002554D69B|nr:protein 60A-like [Microplitis mediator]